MRLVANCRREATEIFAYQKQRKIWVTHVIEPVGWINPAYTLSKAVLDRQQEGKGEKNNIVLHGAKLMFAEVSARHKKKSSYLLSRRIKNHQISLSDKHDRNHNLMTTAAYGELIDTAFKIAKVQFSIAFGIHVHRLNRDEFTEHIGESHLNSA